MSKKALILMIAASLILSAQANAASKVTCDSLKDEIAAKIEHNGVKHYRLEVLDADTKTDGQNVGWCAGGAKHIYFWRETPAAVTSSPAPSATIASNSKTH